MSVFTLCFAGTNCWHDEGQVSRAGADGSHPDLYGPAGYIPVRIYNDIHAPYRKAVIPGAGPAYHAYWKKLWVPCTVDFSPTSLSVGGNNSDSLLGTSMWDLAGHAAARVVGIPSSGTGSPDWTILQDREVEQNIRLAEDMVGVRFDPDSAIDRLAPAKQRYQFHPGLIEVLVNAQHALAGGGPIDRINMIGHSRGAVEAIMCSHALARLFPQAEINIIALDPVPGLGPLAEEMVTLAHTVKNYVGLYTLDECSNGFNAVAPRRWLHDPTEGWIKVDPLKVVTEKSSQRELPNYHLVCVPGRHGTVAGNKNKFGEGELNNEHDATRAVGVLVDRLARGCLRRWGTNVTDQGGLSGTTVTTVDSAILELRNLQRAVRSNAKVYREMRDHTYTFSTGSWREHGISSTSGSDPTAWGYLEDYIGDPPLSGRALTPERGPGEIKWSKIEDLSPRVFLDRSVDLDLSWPTPLAAQGIGSLS